MHNWMGFFMSLDRVDPIQLWNESQEILGVSAPGTTHQEPPKISPTLLRWSEASKPQHKKSFPSQDCGEGTGEGIRHNNGTCTTWLGQSASLQEEEEEVRALLLEKTQRGNFESSVFVRRADGSMHLRCISSALRKRAGMSLLLVA